MRCFFFASPFRVAATLLLTLVIGLGTCGPANGQSDYQLPPDPVVDIIDAPPVPDVSFSPDDAWMLYSQRSAMPGIEELTRRRLHLAGIRIDPVSESRFNTGYIEQLSLAPRDGGERQSVAIPDGFKILAFSWSHDSERFVVMTTSDDGQQLWGVEVAAPGQAKLLTDRLSTVLLGLDWMPDGHTLLCATVPVERGDEPVDEPVPPGPNIQESEGNTSPTRTYQDLLKNPHDDALFDYYARTQLVLIAWDGTTTKLGEPAIWSRASASPSGDQILTERIVRPFSRLMTYRDFPHFIEVWSPSGDLVTEVVEVPMAENIPIEGVRTGPRGVAWMAGFPARLGWTEALDGGDPNAEAEYRDRMMVWDAPFDGTPNEVLRTQHRAFGWSTMAEPTQIMVTDYDRDRRWIRNLLFDLNTPDKAARVIVDRSIRDRYGDPGSIVTRRDENGFPRALQNGDWVYRFGRGASPQGDMPFVDRQNLLTLETERLWQCDEGIYEQPVAIIETGEESLPSLITVWESPTAPPNYRLRDLNDETTVALTEFEDPTPQIRGIHKELVKYKRADGVELSATLYLPADYREGQRLPLLVWAYPREFNDASTASQVSGSPHRFVRMSGITHLTFLTQGYAIMDAAAMPVIGDPETMNDTFIDQIVDSAAAAIDKAVEMGVADRSRVAVGGHSYGAFMTANLLAHCDLFRAGIARSGAYNRTLTPFGFQSERRPFWEASDVYFNISPFMHADKINEPILLIHGENDNNSGTFPMQSRRMYQAVKGNGGTVRLVMLPGESHGYRARESVLHTQAEMIRWLDRHVKQASASTEAAPADDGEPPRTRE